ncbi:MAG: methylenetetrahydrofolate reductase [Christensenellales bacterium]|jgi:methylenetetrahydrofolate reductase (NADPH)
MLENQDKKIIFSLELFPPKAGDSIEPIAKKLGEFGKLAPDYISVTYGTDGSNAPRTIELAELIQREHGVDALAHLTCVGATYNGVREKLEAFSKAGIKNILALRGDRRPGLDIVDFNYATNLIEFINCYGGFSVSAACYPEGHPESGGLKEDFEVLRKKASLGVKHFISQLFFDNDVFFRLLDSAAASGIDALIEAGIMPITNIKQLKGIVAVSGVKIPPRLARQIERFSDSAEALRQAGLNFALEQISELIAFGVKGIHLYVMNNPRTAEYIKSNAEHLFKF